MIDQLRSSRYEMLRLLGEGGMGRVFLARQRGTGREVVIKVLQQDLAAHPQSRESLRQEMLFLSRFRHPNVVALEDTIEQEPHGFCLVMEYIPGLTLEQLLQCHGRLDPERTGRLLGQLCLALHAAQNVGIIHRDLKPANLMVMDPDTPDEKLKVMDFGLAKLGTTLYLPKERLSNPDQFFSACGTPDYICPEQMRGDEVDHRSDLYSVGVVLFELLTGRVPFPRATVADALQAHVSERPPRFADVGVRDVSPAIEAVVQACLAKFPVERPQSARELAERYEKALGHKVTRPEDWVLASVARSSATVPVLGLSAVRPTDPHTVVYNLEAWMPERIAVIKLQGFVQDVGGEVVESVPGVIRVRVPDRRAPAPRPARPGLLALLGLGSREQPPPPPGIDLELHMEKKDVGHQSRLQLRALLRPANGREQASAPGWRECCDEIHRELKAYLIGQG